MQHHSYIDTRSLGLERQVTRDRNTLSDYGSLLIPGPVFVVFPTIPEKLFRLNYHESDIVQRDLVGLAPGSPFDSMSTCYLANQGVARMVRVRFERIGNFADTATDTGACWWAGHPRRRAGIAGP